MKQTILVTGGTGFIGSHTAVELIEAGYNVVIVDNLSNSNIKVLDGIEKITGTRPAFEQVDLRDKEATEGVFKKYPEIDGIIHFAASKAVGESVPEAPTLLSQQHRITGQLVGAHARLQRQRHYLLFQLHRVRPAEAGESSCNRRRSSPKGNFSLRQYQGDQRADYL